MLNISCTEKQYLGEHIFKFDFPANYTEYQLLNQQQFETEIHHQHVLIVNDLKVNHTIMDNNPELKLIALCSTGVEQVDLIEAKKRHIKVCNIRGYAGDSVAEHAFLLMLNLVKNFNFYQHSVHAAQLSNSQLFCYQDSKFPIFDLKNKILVILGKGEIGQSFAKKAAAFGMSVYFSERPNALHCRDGYIPFKDALKIADVFSLHCALSANTQQIINAETLSQMKKTCYLINVSRGGLIHETDVLRALQQGTIAGYAADVMQAEPPPIDHPFLTVQLANLMITPHVAWATEEAKKRMVEILLQNIHANLNGIDTNLVT